MKQIILIGMLLLMVGSVFGATAAGNYVYIQQVRAQQEQEAQQTQAQIQAEALAVPVQDFESDTFPGRVRVRTENQKMELERIWEKAKVRAEFKNLVMEELTLEGEQPVAKGLRAMYFLGIFPGKQQVKYNLNNEGEATRVNHPLDFLWGDEPFFQFDTLN